MDLLQTRREPVCTLSNGGVCTCILTSESGRYGMMYGGTTVGSKATVFTSPNYCYVGDNPVRECESNDQWSGNMINETDIVLGIEQGFESSLYC